MDFDDLRHSLINELEKIAAELSEAQRKELPKKDFALTPGQSSTGDKAYPIDTPGRARAAIGFVGMHGSPQQKSEVYKDVARRYPQLAAKSSVPELKEKAANEVGAPPPVPGPKPMPGMMGANTATGLAPIQPLPAQKIAEAWSKLAEGGGFLHGASKEIGPAIGMMVGAGLGHKYKMNELATSGAGYGGGALAQLAVEHLLKKRRGG